MDILGRESGVLGGSAKEDRRKGEWAGERGLMGPRAIAKLPRRTPFSRGLGVHFLIPSRDTSEEAAPPQVPGYWVKV